MTLPAGVRSYLPARPLLGVKRVLRFAAKIILRPSERAADPYATHVPVLIGLARVLNVERVIEYGCGHYSTLTFLDRSAFPGLTKLRSLENDAEWFEKIAGQVRGDPRVEMWDVSGSMSSAASVTELGGYDLAFIDDSMNASERAATIREVGAKRPKSTVVVVHDYETVEYQRAAGAFANRFKFDSLNPHTGVLWNEASLTRRELRSLNRLIKRHAVRLQPSDVRGWVEALAAR